LIHDISPLKWHKVDPAEKPEKEELDYQTKNKILKISKDENK